MVKSLQENCFSQLLENFPTLNMGGQEKIPGTYGRFFLNWTNYTHHPNFFHIFNFFQKWFRHPPIFFHNFQFFPKIFWHPPIFVQNVSIFPKIFWHPPLFFILVLKDFFYFVFKPLKLLKKTVSLMVNGSVWGFFVL